MKFNKQIAIILVLASFLLSAVGAAYYFYTQNTKTITKMNQKVKVFVVNKPVNSGYQFSKDDLKEHFITQQELITKPLSSGEIIGKYAKVDMFLNEMIIKEKITDTLEKKAQDPIKSDYKNNSYNMAFRMFNNPNYTLQKGDIINIISTYPTTADKLPQYSVQYVAKDVEVLGFILLGKPVAEVFNKIKVKKIENKKEVEKEEYVKADEIVIDIKSDILLNLINDFNRGSQLWMVKTKSNVEEKKQITQSNTQDTISSTDQQDVQKTKNYPYRWYIPASSALKKVATIEYADSADKGLTQTAIIKSDFITQCKENRDDLIIVKVNSAYLRTQPTTRSQAILTVYKNYMIPYTDKIDSWYRTCDGLFIHENTVEEISPNQAQEFLNAR
ncbi:hypothetical protein [Arcobacter sp. FWKO B]|uniref:hypothetical protein n=1 Tax=Arcobacter sp. FWKO B TaxID=2593672 RepID=UPI0018A3F7F2|nr:hypothetical protein [Arcobacter sp. FWKO B]QOG12538.1 hypothetical protein FWKOB_07400 [Arcobacter sp. FWKO B]